MASESAGRVVAISTSKRKGTAKANTPSALLVENWGIDGDAHAGPWHRQVSLLAVESIAKIRERGVDVRPGGFGENITTAGIDIPNLHVGDRVTIGETELEITQIGKECHTRCAIYTRAGDCVMPREGIFGKVVKGGVIRPGEPVALVSRREDASEELPVSEERFASP